MSFFRQAVITIRCVSRGTSLAVPDRNGLLDACEEGLRRRLQYALAKHSAAAPAWTVRWSKSVGGALQPHHVVVALHCDEITVELACAQKCYLAQMLVMEGERVATGTRLARLERRAPTAAASATSSAGMVNQFVLRQRKDAEVIATLQTELAAQQQLVDQLQDQIAALQGRRGNGALVAPDAKFRRLKHEFSKHFHPDAAPRGDTERECRARMFQAFWPIVEQIERS